MKRRMEARLLYGFIEGLCNVEAGAMSNFRFLESLHESMVANICRVPNIDLSMMFIAFQASQHDIT